MNLTTPSTEAHSGVGAHTQVPNQSALLGKGGSPNLRDCSLPFFLGLAEIHPRIRVQARRPYRVCTETVQWVTAFPLAFRPFSASLLGSASPAPPGSPGTAPPQGGPGGREGGAGSRGCVGGGCASRGAWAGRGRRHVETRGQRLAGPGSKITRGEKGGRDAHTTVHPREGPPNVPLPALQKMQDG